MLSKNISKRVFIQAHGIICTARFPCSTIPKVCIEVKTKSIKQPVIRYNVTSSNNRFAVMPASSKGTQTRTSFVDWKPMMPQAKPNNEFDGFISN